MSTNPYAIYVNCDGAMDYKSKNAGGVGFAIRFPESIPLDEIHTSLGIYTGGNIERIEMEALIQALSSLIDLFIEHKFLLKNISQIILITDRFGLCDSERTNVYRIANWRANKWKNHEGKPIKNHELLDKIDKTRRKLSDQAHVRINIEYRPRKQNKVADKLAKVGKKEGLVNKSLAKKGEKIGKRKFEGGEIKYTKLSAKDELHVRVFRKDPVQDEWEVWCELCEGENKGEKLKIYVDDKLAADLQRMNEYFLKLKVVFAHHVRIFRRIKKIESKKGLMS